MSELLPCPFCGYEAELRKQYSALEGEPKHYVRCSNGQCGARYVPGGFPLGEWNARPALESVRSEALLGNNLEHAIMQAASKAGIRPNDRVRFIVDYDNGVDPTGPCDAVMSFSEHLLALLQSPARVAEGGAHEYVDATTGAIEEHTATPSPESPAKEQPGEVAKLIRNLICADTATVVFAAREAAALIEKLWRLVEQSEGDIGYSYDLVGRAEGALKE